MKRIRGAAVSQVEKWAAQLEASRGINIQKQNTKPKKSKTQTSQKKTEKKKKDTQKSYKNPKKGKTQKRAKKEKG